MTITLTITGAFFLIAGMTFGLISVFLASKFQYFLLNEHNDIFRKIAGTEAASQEGKTIDSGKIWRYIQSGEDNGIEGIFRYKNKIRKSFFFFCIFSVIGLASLGIAMILLIFS